MNDMRAGRKVMRMYGAGTVCVDVSSMGNGDGLMGSSSLPLAIWVSELRHVMPAT